LIPFAKGSFETSAALRATRPVEGEVTRLQISEVTKELESLDKH
jgi:hypothetical protein